MCEGGHEHEFAWFAACIGISCILSLAYCESNDERLKYDDDDDDDSPRTESTYNVW